MNEYEELMYKAIRCRQNARTSESDWAYWYWTDCAEKLEEKALQIPVENLR